jgi:hypothetical protein
MREILIQTRPVDTIWVMDKRNNVPLPKALQRYVAKATAKTLRERLKRAAIRDRGLDLAIAGDWFTVDQEQWQKLDEQQK